MIYTYIEVYCKDYDLTPFVCLADETFEAVSNFNLLVILLFVLEI